MSTTSLRSLVVIGSGFAGVWAALAAARQRKRLGLQARIAITIVSPHDYWGIRPRYYEAEFAAAKVALAPLLAPAGVAHVRATVVGIDQARRVLALDAGTLPYDALVCAAGSATTRPSLPGAELMHDVDSFAAAAATERHLRAMAAAPRPSPAAATVVVIGGGFTGLEAATELMARLAALFGGRARPRVILVERAPQVGSEFGPDARAVIAAALAQVGVETRLGTSVHAIAPDGVTLTTGERLAARTVLWTAGVQASPLARLVAPNPDATVDAHGRVAVDSTLRVAASHAGLGAADGAPIWVAGDCARAHVDGAGGAQPAMMSCQHATPQGKYAGHNALSWLAGKRPLPYEQRLYLTCLDLGDWGALMTLGFARNRIIGRGREAKPFKRLINERLIYPPLDGDADALWRAAKPPAGGRLASALLGRVLASPRLRALILSRAHMTPASPPVPRALATSHEPRRESA